jgi:hypothetical protein
MNDTIIVGAFMLILLAAVSFYFYSRLVYAERKIGLLESILLDLKMAMEMSENEHDHLPGGVPASNKIVESAPAGVTSEEEAAFYSSVLEEVQKEAASSSEEATMPPAAPWNTLPFTPDLSGPTGTLEPTTTLPQSSQPSISKVEVNYEAMTRDELAVLAEKRGLRTTKRMSKQNIISLVREADKNTYGTSETGRDAEADGPSGASTGIASLEGSNSGAPLDMEQVEDISSAL